MRKRFKKFKGKRSGKKMRLSFGKQGGRKKYSRTVTRGGVML